MARERDDYRTEDRNHEGRHAEDRHPGDRDSGDQGREQRTKGPEPELLAYTVRDRGEGQDSVWNRIGAAWSHRDGRGFDVALSSNPLDGRISLRENRREEFKEQRRNTESPSRSRER